MKHLIKTKTVYAALSGGVDSSVAAALLVQKGYRVVGVFMRQYDYADVQTKKEGMLACAQEDDRLSALAVARHLDIPFFAWDFRHVYHTKVVNYLFREYARGRTPNPDIMCNVYVKFGAFLKRARKEGADVIATGHYARKKELKITNYELRIKKQKIIHTLLKAKDTQKDQTYFLSLLFQNQLRYSMFPVGEYIKTDVRNMAKKFGLPTWNRKDSQGLCFVGNVDMKDFLSQNIPSKPGPTMTKTGTILGTHHGAAYYTIGQRHGLGLPGGDGPYFVTSLDIRKNIIFVAKDEKKSELFSHTLTVPIVHWISGITPTFPFSCTARIRYRQPLEACSVKCVALRGTQQYNIVFKKPQRAVTPGQIIAFYKGHECLGGGIIQ